jgi:hypothetical protein
LEKCQHLSPGDPTTTSPGQCEWNERCLPTVNPGLYLRWNQSAVILIPERGVTRRLATDLLHSVRAEVRSRKRKSWAPNSLIIQMRDVMRVVVASPRPWAQMHLPFGRTAQCPPAPGEESRRRLELTPAHPFSGRQARYLFWVRYRNLCLPFYVSPAAIGVRNRLWSAT